MISINILSAADGVIVPTLPSMYDFASTTQYFKMVKRVVQSVTPEKRFRLHQRSCPPRWSATRRVKWTFWTSCATASDCRCCAAFYLDVGDSKCGKVWHKTLYDLPKGSRDNAIIDMLDEVFGEIEALIRKAREDVA